MNKTIKIVLWVVGSIAAVGGVLFIVMPETVKGWFKKK